MSLIHFKPIFHLSQKSIRNSKVFYFCRGYQGYRNGTLAWNELYSLLGLYMNSKHWISIRRWNTVVSRNIGRVVFQRTNSLQKMKYENVKETRHFPSVLFIIFLLTVFIAWICISWCRNDKCFGLIKTHRRKSVFQVPFSVLLFHP